MRCSVYTRSESENSVLTTLKHSVRQLIPIVAPHASRGSALHVTRDLASAESCARGLSPAGVKVFLRQSKAFARHVQSCSRKRACSIAAKNFQNTFARPPMLSVYKALAVQMPGRKKQSPREGKHLVPACRKSKTLRGRRRTRAEGKKREVYSVGS